MNLSKKRIESFLDRIGDPYIQFLRSNSCQQGVNNMSKLLLLLNAGQCLGIFSNTLSDICELDDYIENMKSQHADMSISDLREGFQKQLKKVMTKSAKKTLGVQDEESSEHQD